MHKVTGFLLSELIAYVAVASVLLWCSMYYVMQSTLFVHAYVQKTDAYLTAVHAAMLLERDIATAASDAAYWEVMPTKVFFTRADCQQRITYTCDGGQLTRSVQNYDQDHARWKKKNSRIIATALETLSSTLLQEHNKITGVVVSLTGYSDAKYNKKYTIQRYVALS